MLGAYPDRGLEGDKLRVQGVPSQGSVGGGGREVPGSVGKQWESRSG